jgi:BirA family biotin operon repressor/biotin-[acetyl-CoA-carboxylase] ligase
VRIAPHVEGNLIWHRSVGSTNDVARFAGRSGDADGTLVLAEEQTAGRGRRRRVWHSPPGLGIYATLLIREGSWLERPALAQLGTGLAVAEVAAGCSPAEVELIWPNDCYAAGAKIAGVLAEAETTGGAIEFLVCGLGVNVNHRRDQLPEEIRAHAASLAQLGGGAHGVDTLDRTDLVIAMIERLRVLRQLSDAEGPEALVRRWTAMSPSSMDSEVQVDTMGGILSGRTAGLNAEGALRVRPEGSDAITEITVGELVRVRRRR